MYDLVTFIAGGGLLIGAADLVLLKSRKLFDVLAGHRWEPIRLEIIPHCIPIRFFEAFLPFCVLEGVTETGVDTIPYVVIYFTARNIREWPVEFATSVVETVNPTA